MQNIKYSDFVRKLSKPGGVIADELTPEDCHQLHMAMGISGEAGELLDAVKKAVIYRKPLDVANVREEAGDILFYVTGILNSIGATLEEVIDENMEKLSLRYQSLAYSNSAAIQRADKDHGAEISAETTTEADDDFNEIVTPTCTLGEDCESCQ
jgi:NTP pyrophosphatase (non-canonical NTP hydrolase)